MLPVLALYQHAYQDLRHKGNYARGRQYVVSAYRRLCLNRRWVHSMSSVKRGRCSQPAKGGHAHLVPMQMLRPPCYRPIHLADPSSLHVLQTAAAVALRYSKSCQCAQARRLWSSVLGFFEHYSQPCTGDRSLHYLACVLWWQSARPRAFLGDHRAGQRGR